jgi:hypothetical protein
VSYPTPPYPPVSYSPVKLGVKGSREIDFDTFLRSGRQSRPISRD